MVRVGIERDITYSFQALSSQNHVSVKPGQAELIVMVGV